MQTHTVAWKEESLQQAGCFRLGKAERGHEARGGRVIKEFRGALGRYRDREWAERLAALHVFIQVLFDVGRPGRSQQAAVSERARAEFGGTAKPPHDFSSRKQLYSFFQDLFLAHVKPVAPLAIVQNLLDFLAGVARPPGQLGCRSMPGLSLHVMAHVPCGAQSSAFVSRGGLNEGTALGAAWYVRHHMQGKPRHAPATQLAWGPGYSSQEIKQVLDNCKARYRFHVSEEQILEETVQLLATGKIVA